MGITNINNRAIPATWKSMEGCLNMVSEAKGRFFRRKDGKYLLYIPKHLAEDSMFPFKENPSVSVRVSFEIGDRRLTVQKWEEEADC